MQPPFTVYRDQLTSLYRGLALWKPKPLKEFYDQVSIGDVGYICEGEFIRMFNVMLPWDDKSNKILGEPMQYEPLSCGPFANTRRGSLDAGVYCSHSVSSETNTGKTQAMVPDDEEGLTYKCHRSRGALLFLPHEGHSEDVVRKKAFEDYLRDHVASWFTWTQDNKLDVNRIEELILVTGCTLATSWAVAAFVNSTMDSEISLATRTLGENGGANFIWSNMRGPVPHSNSRLDPQNPSIIPDQCIFIRGFRAKRVLFWTRPIQAAAEPPPDDPDNRSDDEIQVTEVSGVPKYRDPVMGVLDYIVEKGLEDTMTEDTIAIAHDDDLQLIEDVETLTADAVEKFLHEKQMPLRVENGVRKLHSIPLEEWQLQVVVVDEQKAVPQVVPFPSSKADHSGKVYRVGEDAVIEGTQLLFYIGKWTSDGERTALGRLRDQSLDSQKRFKEWIEASLSLQHRNILNFVGHATINDVIYSVNLNPWLEHGNMREYLRRNPDADRVCLLSEVASGVEFLHERKIPHGDLCDKNILINRDGKAIVCGFDFSEFSKPTVSRARWLAPEQITSASVAAPTEKADIWSFGLLCLEVFTGKDPYHGHSDFYVPVLLHQATPPEHPGSSAVGLSPKMWDLMQSCWQISPVQRPSMPEIKSTIHDIFVRRDGRQPVPGNIDIPIPTLFTQAICKATPLTSSDPTGGLPFSARPTNDIEQDSSDLMSDRIPGIEDNMMKMRMGQMDSSADLHTFIRPYIDQYVRTPNRLVFGERTIIVMSSKVAQKSYGTQKRFLYPPPTAILIGNSWWSEIARRGDESELRPPRVRVSISGEASGQDNVEWSEAMGKPFDPSYRTYIGRCVGTQLFISDADKKTKVEALVKVTGLTGVHEPERVIAVFPSRPIKIFQPIKTRRSAKNLEMCITHGSTISLFHRLRSQPVSTKYLCVSESDSSFKGSDGAPLMGIDQRTLASTPSFIVKTSSWDPFVIYIVDAEVPTGEMDAPPPPPIHPDYPSPPPNAIPFMNSGTPIAIYHNQTVVLQCLTSGFVSPVLIIRKVDRQTTVVGRSAQGSKGVGEHYCVPGEVCGDPVSQLDKVAFEVFEPGKGAPESGLPGQTGAFLSCVGEKVNTYRPVDGRLWKNDVDGPRSPDSPVVPSSPMISTPALNGSDNDYFGSGPSSTTHSEPASPVLTPMELSSSDGGRVKKRKRGSSSAGGLSKSGTSSKRRRRPAYAAAWRIESDSGASQGGLWQVDIGETSVWTIVGIDQVRYSFYVPPVLFDNQNSPQMGSYPVPSKPITPFPSVVKYLPPDPASSDSESETPQHHETRHMLAKPSAQTSKLLTLYGENFSKTDPVSVFFGSAPSPFVDVRSSEVLGCVLPEQQTTERQPILLVRGDGVVFPSSVMYP